MVVMAIVMTMFSANADVTAKTKIPKIPKKISGYEGFKKKIKVGKATIKVSNKKICAANVKNSKLTIRFLRKGNANVTIKGSGFKKIIKVSVKRRNVKRNSRKDITGLHFNTEDEANKFFDGYGDKYKNDIESYEYLKDYKNMSNDARAKTPCQKLLFCQ